MDILYFLLKPIFFENNHLVFKDVPVVLFQQLLVGKIDAKLLKGVVSKIFKAKDIQEVDGVQRFIGMRIQGYLYLVDDEFEDGVVYGLAKSIPISDASILAISLKESLLLLEHSLFKKQQLL